jgi:hypothetical protein
MILWTSLTLAIFASGLSLTADVKKDRIKFMDVVCWECRWKNRGNNGARDILYIFDKSGLGRIG